MFDYEEDNIQLLNDYLRKNNLSLNKKECRAILFAINGMTIYYQTKPQAIDKASQTFHVTKKFIKKHLDELGIVSQRAIQAKKDFGRAQGVAMGLLKRKMAEEDE